MRISLLLRPRFEALALALLALTPSFPLAGRAQTIEIQFDLSGSTLSAAGGLVEVPPDGSITAGALTLEVSGADVATPLPGAASLRDFALDLTIDGAPRGGAVMGYALTGQNGAVAGTLSGALDQLTLSDPLSAGTLGSLDCAGALCGLLGSFPAAFNDLEASDPPLAFDLADLSTVGAAQISGSLPLTLGGQVTTLLIAGTEGSRTFLPEPSGLLPLAAGVGLLARLARRRRP